MQANPYRAEAEDLRARMLATTDAKLRKQLRERAEFYEAEARRFDQQKGKARRRVNSGFVDAGTRPPGTLRAVS